MAPEGRPNRGPGAPGIHSPRETGQAAGVEVGVEELEEDEDAEEEPLSLLEDEDSLLVGSLPEEPDVPLDWLRLSVR
jgi:hypothetical protein